MAQRYWVSGSASNWNNTSNWSLTSGGAGGQSVPIYDSTVFFDSGGIGSCTIDTTVSVMGLNVSTGYSGVIGQNSYDMTVGSLGFYLNDGSFGGQSANVRIDGTGFIGGCRFTSTDRTLSLGGILTFSPAGSGYFHANGGIVSLDASQAGIVATDMTLSTLQCNAVSNVTGKIIVDNLVLNSGALGKLGDSTVHIYKDLYSNSGYNFWSSLNNATLLLDGSHGQNIYNQSGSVIPMLFVDKKTTEQVMCHGTGPLSIRGDFLILDGTFNSGGLDIEIGLLNFTQTAELIVFEP